MILNMHNGDSKRLWKKACVEGLVEEGMKMMKVERNDMKMLSSTKEISGTRGKSRRFLGIDPQ